MSRSTPTILVADDDPGVRAVVTQALQINGFSVVTCGDGVSALDLCIEVEPALAILDVLMPKMDGISVCRALRSRSDVPIMMLTGLEDESDAARSLAAGADDYVRKPFGMDELVARVRALLRRARGEPGTDRLAAGPLVIDEAEHRVLLHDRDVALSPTEFRLLDHLVRNQSRVLTHDQLLARVWGREYAGSHHLLRVAISRLRQKLDGSGAGLIETLAGVGYRFRRQPLAVVGANTLGGLDTAPRQDRRVEPEPPLGGALTRLH